MKLGNDVLLAIVAAMRKGITEGVDISDLLKALDVEPDGNGAIKLSGADATVWSIVPEDVASKR